jgi:16S rRNA (adenine1518-N6/adenine1519-N6)-dimethyltransferase
VFVVNPAGELLLQRRAEAKDYYPGYWDASVGGQVIAGESYEEAAVRELEEELGCRGGKVRLVGKYDSYSERQREKRALFVYEAEGPFDYSEKEIEELRFVAAEDVERMLAEQPFTEGFRRSFSLWSSSR